MSDVTISPNMGLSVPDVGLDVGPDWANNINADLSILDGHNHGAGSGVQITPDGININLDLPFNNFNATLLRSVRFEVQPSNLSLATDLGCLYVSGVDLYYNDENGNQVRITSGGAVNATSSGITSGTATASFVANVLVVDQAANTPANIQVGSILIGNNTAGSNFVTVSAPSALASSYSITLPLLPGSNLPLSINASGVESAAQITTSQIANQAVTTTQIANQTITQGNLALRATGSTVAAGGVASSSPTTASTSTTAVVVSVTITTTGRPVFIGLANGYVEYAQAGGLTAQVSLLNGATPVMFGEMSSFNGAGNDTIVLPASSIWGIDFPVAGTYTYNFQMSANGGGSTMLCNSVVLVAYEL